MLASVAVGRGLTGAGVLLAITAACGGGSSRLRSAVPPVPRTTIFATAPDAIGLQHLGRPYDVHFEPLAGPESRPIFDGSASVTQTDINSFEHRFASFEDTITLGANFSGWGISGDAGVTTTQRYAVFRAYQVAYVREIDDTHPVRHLPSDASFYLARIYYGHRYEAILSGDARTFNAGVRAAFVVASGGVAAFAGRAGLQVSYRGRGFVPNDGIAIFARTPEEITSAYSARGEPVAIFVDYRSIPERRGSPATPIEWAASTPTVLTLRDLRVFRDGTLGTSTWQMDIACRSSGRTVHEEPAIWFDREVDDEGDLDERGVGCRRYTLNWAPDAPWQLASGESVECVVGGREIEDNESLPAATIRFRVGEPTAGATGRVSASAGDMSYDLNYSIEYVQAPGAAHH